MCIWAGMTTEEITDQGVRYKDLKDNQIEDSGWGKKESGPQKSDKKGVGILGGTINFAREM